MFKISIIIPIYNLEQFLSKALESCINQTYKNIEIICINDGSTDNSLNLLKEFKNKDNRIKIINQVNKGVSIARNVGMKYASGKYLLFLDGDDYLDLQTCEKIYYKNLSSDFDILFYNILSFSKSMERRKHSIKPYKNCKNYYLIYSNDWICGCYKKDFLLKHKIKFPEKIKISEDHIFKLKALYNNPQIAFIDDFLYHHLSERNTSATKDWNNYLTNQLHSYIYLKNTEFYKNLDKIKQLYITDIWGFYMFCTWVKYPMLNKKQTLLIKEFLDFYKGFENKKYKRMYGYRLLKYKIIFKMLYNLKNIINTINCRKRE